MAKVDNELDPRREYVALVERRSNLERELAELQDQIVNYEKSYLEDSPHGNAILGWEALKQSKTDKNTSKPEIKPKHYLFSSSSTWTSLPKSTVKEARKRQKDAESTNKSKKAKRKAADNDDEDDNDDHDSTSSKPDGKKTSGSTPSSKSKLKGASITKTSKSTSAAKKAKRTASSNSTTSTNKKKKTPGRKRK
eukprot:TRINITY_DN5020_c0_g1_i1.p1 TRINITY_DN5020_c0_g1~~TRINITY_DN5020_c0_g1_i1.p1  ORF type:complete len:194 (+),score=52.35 TRINITY_DN5020_c0_g1_i1:76-657(+)